MLALAGSDGWLCYSVRQQRTALDSFASRQAQTLPTAGEAVPPLVGRKLSTGKDSTVVPASSPPLTLLVFREACHYCEANWKHWEELFGNSDRKLPVVFVSGDNELSASYREKHPMLEKNITLIGIKQDVLATLKLGATPQTILVVDGKIKQDWVGVLSDGDIKEVKEAVAKQVALRN